MIKIKKIYNKGALALSFVILSSTVAYAKPVKSDFKMNINGKNIKLSTPLLVENNRTLIPLRLAAEELGYKVIWKEDTRTVEIIEGNDKLEFPIDSNIIKVNNEKKEIDSKARIYTNRTYIPIRAMENLKALVDWKEKEKTVIVQKNKGVNLVEGDVNKDTEKKEDKRKSNKIDSFDYWNYYNDYDNKILMTYAEIKEFNIKNLNREKTLININNIGESIDSDRIIKEMKRVTEFKTKRYNPKGKIYTEEDHKKIIDNMNIPTSSSLDVKRGIVNKRTMMRTYPTNDGFFKTSARTLDMAVETALYPWEEIVIYHESADGKWVYGEMFNSYGWILKEDISLTSKSEYNEYFKEDNFVVVTTDKVKLKGKQFDMGTKIPLVSENESSYTVLVPQNSLNLEVETAEISKDNANKGYLEFTQANIIRQALKFYGEIYGWGGLKNTRDCSGLIQDVYRSFGILIPRNSGHQGESLMGITKSLRGKNTSDKLKLIKEVGPGASIQISGHVMMYLGENEKGVPMVIHQYIGHYENGKYKSANKADITTMNIVGENKKTYLENSYGIKLFVD